MRRYIFGLMGAVMMLALFALATVAARGEPAVGERGSLDPATYTVKQAWLSVTAHPEICDVLRGYDEDGDPVYSSPLICTPGVMGDADTEAGWDGREASGQTVLYRWCNPEYALVYSNWTGFLSADCAGGDASGPTAPIVGADVGR